MEIVTCHYKEDLRWLEASPYPVNVVGKEGGDTALLDASKFKSVNIIPNFGMEASSYLWYIINNYGDLPERMAFVHGHEKSPHQRIPIFQAIEKYGDLPFADLNRYLNTYMLVLPGSVAERMWDDLMRPHFGKIPRILNFRGMAQFAIRREVVLSRPEWFYRNLYEKSLRIYESESKSPTTSKWLGFFFEWVWHIIFGIESPTPPYHRPNVFYDGPAKELVFYGDTSLKNDYLDIFLDSDMLIYRTNLDFMRKIASLAHN